MKNSIKFSIAKEIFDKYPQTSIGYLVADVIVKKTDSYVEDIKNNLSKSLSDEFEKMGIKDNNYASHPNIDNWRRIFKDFEVSKGYRSSVEALVRRISKGDKMWNVSNVVDLYNCFSVLFMIPMGGYDLNKIKGNITLRFGKESDNFDPLGSKEKMLVNTNHVVYSDDERIICWLWNYRDSKFTSIDEKTKQVVFFFDSAFESPNSLEKTIQMFKEKLTKIGGKTLSEGILDINKQEVEIVW